MGAKWVELWPAEVSRRMLWIELDSIGTQTVIVNTAVSLWNEHAL